MAAGVVFQHDRSGHGSHRDGSHHESSHHDGSHHNDRHDLLARISEARHQTDHLFQLVRKDALYDRPIAERHRLIFYVGHLEAFDWNLLGTSALARTSPREMLDQLFAFGIDPTSASGLPTDKREDWPKLDEVERYKMASRLAIDECVHDERVPLQLLQVALEHRLMHAETLAYLLHRLPLDRKELAPQDSFWTDHKVTPHMVHIPAGVATLGMNSGSAFGWDNEFGEQKIDVPEFQIDVYNVTNGEFMDFVKADCYRERGLWSDEAWNWIQERDIRHPGFWVQRESAWHYRGMFAETRLPLDWPVYVSHAEAAAYARWKNRHLPTEAQFHRAAYGHLSGSESVYPWGSKYPEQNPGNFDFRRWDPAPVGAYPDTTSAFGVADLVGNGWEWTSTVFAPFPGFEPFSFYQGYSADFFDGKHYVMKGASARTAACMLRRTFRNWFQPLYPNIYTAFRCVSRV